MGRTLRTARAGEKKYAVGLVPGTTGTVRIGNFGVTEVTTEWAGMYVLGAPEAGIEKTFIATRVPATAVSVNLSTAETVTVAGSTAVTSITFSTAADNVGSVTLVGVNTTEWAVKSLYNAGSTACVALSTAAA